jgi:hypothetical protein
MSGRLVVFAEGGGTGMCVYREGGGRCESPNAKFGVKKGSQKKKQQEAGGRHSSPRTCASCERAHARVGRTAAATIETWRAVRA